MTSPRRYGRQALAYGVYLLFPALLFGTLLAVVLGREPGASWLAIVAGTVGAAFAVWTPSPARRRATNRLFTAQFPPPRRANWEELLSLRRPARVALVLAPPALCLLAVLLYAVARLPWREPTLGQGIAVVVFAAPAFCALTWALQWIVVGWEAQRDRG